MGTLLLLVSLITSFSLPTSQLAAPRILRVPRCQKRFTVIDSDFEYKRLAPPFVPSFFLIAHSKPTFSPSSLDIPHFSAINDEGKVAGGGQESNTQARWRHFGSAT